MNRIPEALDGGGQAAKMFRMQEPHVHLWREIFHFYDLQTPAQRGCTVKLWHDHSEPYSVRDESKFKVVAFGLNRGDERQAATPKCSLQYLALATFLWIKHP